MTSISDTEVVNAPGGYVELASTVLSVDSSIVSAGSNAVVIGPITAICDGSPVLVEYQAPRVDTGASGGGAYFVIEVDGVAQGRIGEQSAGNAANSFRVSARLTPSVGSHTFQIRMYPYTSAAAVRATSATWAVGSCYLRVSKIIQASQLLVTQSNAPLVTQLPSGNLVDGQRVDLYANNVVYPERWNASTSAWNFVGAPNIQQGVSNTSQTYSTASTWQNTNLSVSITPSSTTSRIMLNMSAFLSTSAAGVLGEWRIIRNSTTVISPNRTGPATGQTINGLIPDFNTNRGLNGIPFVTLDSPTSTSAQTYTLQVYPNGAISVYLNRWGLDANWAATSSIIAQEIPA